MLQNTKPEQAFLGCSFKHPGGPQRRTSRGTQSQWRGLLEGLWERYEYFQKQEHLANAVHKKGLNARSRKTSQRGGELGGSRETQFMNRRRLGTPDRGGEQREWRQTDDWLGLTVKAE